MATTFQIPIERLTAGVEIIVPGFGPAEVYGVRFDGEGYAVDYCMDDRRGWDALDLHYVNAGTSVEYAGIGEPVLRDIGAVTFDEWAAANVAAVAALELSIAKLARPLMSEVA